MSWPGTSLCMSPHAENAARANFQSVIQEHHFNVSRQGTPEIAFIWTCWALFPPANMETSMCWWSSINSHDGSRWSRYIFKMPSRLREHFSRIKWCVGGCHSTYTEIKGGTLRVHSFTVSAVCWKPLKAVRPLTGLLLMDRWNAIIS